MYLFPIATSTKQPAVAALVALSCWIAGAPLAAGQGLSEVIAAKSITKWTSPQKFTLVAGAANDIAVAADGTAFAIGTTTAPGGFEIFSMAPTASSWTKVAGGATRIAAGGTIVAVVNSQGTVFRSTDGGQNWSSLPGLAIDIGVDDKENIFVIGMQGMIFEMKAGTQSWNQLAAVGRTDASRIAASGDQQVAVSAANAIFLLDASNSANPWRTAPNSTAPVRDVALAGLSLAVGTINALIDVVDTAGLMSQCGTASGVLAAGGNYQAVAANSKAIWVVDQGNRIYKANM